MPRDLIPEDVQKFIFENIDSVAHLEGLLLFRANPEAGWNSTAISQRLYIDEDHAAEVLFLLRECGFITAAAEDADLYRYQPNSTELEQMIDRVAEIYAEYLLPVTHFIHSKPKMRIQEFANAFRIRKD